MTNRICVERTPDVWEIEEAKTNRSEYCDERIVGLSENYDYESNPSRSLIIASCNDEFFYDDYELSNFNSNDLSWNQEHMFW